MLGRTPIKTRSNSAPRDGRSTDGPRNVHGGNDGNHHCKACADEDNTRMVQCDRCDDWYHFECVEVSQGVASRDWQCSKCLSVAKGGRKKASTKEPSSDPAVSTSVQTNPAIRVTSVPLNVVPQIPTTLPVLPNVTTSGDVNESMISHVPSNMMFPPMSTHSSHPSNTHVTVSTCTASMLIPPSIFTLAGISVPPHSLQTFTSSNPLSQPAVYAAPNAFPGMADIRQCFPASSGPQIVPAVTNIPLASSTIIPTTGHSARQTSNEPLKSTSNAPRNNAKQVFGETSSQHSEASKRSTKQKQLELELKMLDEERKLQEEENLRKREYLQKRYAILLEIASESSSVAEVEDERVEDRIDEWINNGMNVGRASVNQEPPPLEIQGINVAMQPPSNNVHPSYIQPISTRTFTGQHENVPLRQPRMLPTSTMERCFQIPSNAPAEPFHRPQVTHANIDRPNIRQQPSQQPRNASSLNLGRSSLRHNMYEDDEGNNLTRSQVVARQAVSRELPTFSGTPEEWPLFFSSFTTTTNMCGYTTEENLVRLQKCLTGKAFESVKCMLMHPMNVTQIISTLKMRFGNPEVIVHNLMAKISSTPAPKVDKLDTIIEFALAVQNLCATIEACQLNEYSYNVALLRELVDKLPASIKLDWARYRRNFSSVNLSIFSSWLYELAEDICPLASLPNDAKAQRLTKNRPAFLNAHADDIDIAPKNSSHPSVAFQSKPTDAMCVVCKSNCPSVDKCQRFDELGYTVDSPHLDVLYLDIFPYVDDSFGPFILHTFSLSVSRYPPYLDISLSRCVLG